MPERPRSRLFLPLAAALILAAALEAKAPARAGEAQGNPTESRVKKTGKDSYRIGNVTLDARRREIRFPAAVNMDEGLIEVFLATPVGKLHEALLVADIDPLDLQLALILLGARAGSNPSVPPGKEPGPEERGGGPEAEFQEADDHAAGGETPAQRKPGSIVSIRIEWKDKGETVSAAAEDLVLNASTRKPMGRSGWVFLGSKIGKDGTFAARLYGSVITTFHDPLAVLDNPAPTTLDDTLFYVNAEKTPKKGAGVEVVIHVPEEKGDARDVEERKK